MPSTNKYLAYILDQLSLLDEVTYRPMMGEFILYYRGEIFGGIYDDRFLVKPVSAAKKHLPDAAMESPYPGAKPMLMPDNLDDRESLCRLISEMYDELPAPKQKPVK